jgi:hypothetical protein
MLLDMKQLDRMSIRAKVIFAIRIAEPFLEELDGEAKVVAAKGLELASAWQMGKGVTGEDLYRVLLNEHDEGLLIYADRRAPKPSDLAISVIGGVISYVCNYAYQVAGERSPDGIDQATDDFLPWIVKEAETSSSFDEPAMAALSQILLDRYAVKDGNKLGEPILNMYLDSK